MKKAIIIGASSGLGREVAQRLLEEGWKLGICSRRIEALESIQEKYGKENVIAAKMDVMEESAADVLAEMIEQLGSPDLFFLASGIGVQNRELDL